MAMELLGNRFYDLDEIAEATKSTRDSGQLKRDVTRKLDAWGYQYEWHNRRGVTISAHNLTPEIRLKELLVKRLNLSNETEPLDFAHFIIALSHIPGFDTMPWRTRASVMYNYTGKYVAESTIRGWTSKLIKADVVMKGGKDALWHTYRDNGIKRQEWVDIDDARYKEYCARRTETLEALKQTDLPPSKHWGTMVKMLCGQYGRYYYCSRLMLNALGDDVDELYDLVEQITEQQG